MNRHKVQEILVKLSQSVIYVSKEEIAYVLKHLENFVEHEKSRHVSGTVNER